jgi:AcrR family transcriptional regulator
VIWQVLGWFDSYLRWRRRGRRVRMTESFIHCNGRYEPVPRSEEANQQLRETQRARIVEAARNVFARKGLAGTMVDVAEEAGVSQGLAYRYFASKEELFRVVVAEAMRAAPSSNPQTEPAATPGQRIEALISNMVEARRAHPEFIQLIDHVANDPETPGDLLTQMGERAKSLAVILRRLIVEGQETGEVTRDDPDQLVTAIIACIVGLGRVQGRHADGSTASVPSADIILRLVRPPAAEEDA